MEGLANQSNALHGGFEVSDDLSHRCVGREHFANHVRIPVSDLLFALFTVWIEPSFFHSKFEFDAFAFFFFLDLLDALDNLWLVGKDRCVRR